MSINNLHNELARLKKEHREYDVDIKYRKNFLSAFDLKRKRRLRADLKKRITELEIKIQTTDPTFKP